MPHSNGRLSASTSSHHSLSSAAFITNIAESDFRHAQVAARATPTLRQPRLGQALGDAREIARVLVGEHALALRERELWVDLHELGPDRARLLRAAEMAVAGGEHHAA